MTHGHESRPQSEVKKQQNMMGADTMITPETDTAPTTAPASNGGFSDATVDMTMMATTMNTTLGETPIPNDKDHLYNTMTKAKIPLDSPTLKERLASRTKTEAEVTDFLISLQLQSFRKALEKELRKAEATMKRDMARLTETHTKSLDTTLSSIRENASTLRQILRFSPLTLSIAAILLTSLTSFTITSAVITLSERRTLSALSTLGLTPVRKDKEIYLLFQDEAMLMECRVADKLTPCIKTRTLR